MGERQTVDDVFIFLRTARNLAEHGEYAFNPGPLGAHVEGTSSAAWTLVLALAWRLGLTGIGFAKAASLLVAALLPVLCALAVRRVAPERPWLMAIPAVALALDADLATWAVSGMDTALWAVGCVGCIALVPVRSVAAVALGALAWLRPEGPLFTALAIVALARDRRELVRLGAVAAVPLGLLELGRLAYFHALVPNTFWAKMNAVDGKDYTGAGYLASALTRRPLLLLVLPGLAFVRARREPVVRVALAVLVASLVFAGVAGGDWMPGRRLLVVALPAAAVASAIGLARIRSRAFAGAAGIALLLEAGLTTDHALDQTWRRDEWLDQRVAHWRLPDRPFRTPHPLDWMPVHLMSIVAPYTVPGDAVAHVDVGEMPYVMADVRFLDGFGLVDREAGRLAFSPSSEPLRAAAREAFFAARPVAAIVVLDERAGRPFAPAQDAALADPRFAEGWKEIARLRTWGDHPCVVYARRDIPPADRPTVQRRIDTWLSRVPDVTAVLD